MFDLKVKKTQHTNKPCAVSFIHKNIMVSEVRGDGITRFYRRFVNLAWGSLLFLLGCAVPEVSLAPIITLFVRQATTGKAVSIHLHRDLLCFPSDSSADNPLLH